jgi:hypothetical protein
MSGFSLALYYEHVHSHDFIWPLLIACTISLYNLIHMEGWKPCANRGAVCTLENFQWCGELFFVDAAVLRGGCLPLIPRRKPTAMAAGSRYIASVRTAQKTPLWTVTPMLRVTQPLAISVCFSGPTALALSIYATVQALFTQIISLMYLKVHISWSGNDSDLYCGVLYLNLEHWLPFQFIIHRPWSCCAIQCSLNCW